MTAPNPGNIPPPAAAPSLRLPVKTAAGKAILLVEDDPINQKVVCKVLEKHGYLVISADNGRQALAILEKRSFDLILMDMQMPELNGVETTRVIRAGGVGRCRPGVPIIALTAHSGMVDRERFFAAGVNDYIAKPFQINDLLDKVGRYCAKRPGKEDDGPDQLPVLHLPEVLERFAADRELITECWEAFRNTAPAQVASAMRALGRGDLERAAGEAHALKGAAGNIGAICFENMAHGLQLAAADNDNDRARRCGARLKDELCRLLAEIDLHLASDSFRTGVK